MVGFRFEGLYLPWALIAFTVLVGGNPIMDIFGVIAGHLYYFLLEVLPLQRAGICCRPLPCCTLRHSTWLFVHVSRFIADFERMSLSVCLRSANLFPSPQVAVGGVPIIGARGAAGRGAVPQGGGYAWGTGRPLGTE